MTITLGIWVLPLILTVVSLGWGALNRDQYGITEFFALCGAGFVWLVYFAARTLFGMPA